ncbi:hypothetical protein Psed_5475 [Pseudonocardia dioxanivorans CB1190]|uniref:Uncharacterized protein n=1 Tax=Pseudonocardia dioxanivorans (strain ATCC 55486 / DSM 44775 / JCM 13855 / CB1190) TaxID=675635 RepID=F4CXM5_PSEUX|nr:hypothetical protein [Pseudonocardia dioxanivorans]AEA27608.1 hypothetical protein Psed_5475 [Pseudonocardia dioxanivorans CB1190]
MTATRVTPAVPMSRSFMDLPTQRLVPPAHLAVDARNQPAQATPTSLGSGVESVHAVGAARTRSRLGTIIDVAGRVGTIVTFAAVVIVSAAVGASAGSNADSGDAANAGMTLGAP